MGATLGAAINNEDYLTCQNSEKSQSSSKRGSGTTMAAMIALIFGKKFKIGSQKNMIASKKVFKK
jgi:hypothetical protein